MEENGFILLSRSILHSDVFASQKLLKIWIWCLCKANFEERKIPIKSGKGELIVSVKRGQFLFGRFKAEEELFIDGSTVYKSMIKLKELQMIDIESNKQYSVVSICNYDYYQSFNSYKLATKEQPSNNEVTAKGQPSNTTNTLNTLNTLNNSAEEKKEISLNNKNNLENKRYSFKLAGEVIEESYTDYFKKNYPIKLEALFTQNKHVLQNELFKTELNNEACNYTFNDENHFFNFLNSKIKNWKEKSNRLMDDGILM